MDSALFASRARVLCVDDEPHVLRALTWLLGRQFDVCTATNAADALGLVQKNDYDVVISDQRMPGVSGVDFLRDVRKCAPRAMRILLTGYSDLDAVVRSANESEVFRFVTKPWNVQELSNLVAEAAAIARSAPVEPAAMEHEEAPAADAAPETVLLIDDPAQVPAFVSEELRGIVNVKHASNVAQALDILEKETIAVMITEMKVGELDATRLVRVAKRSYPELVSVVFSDTRDAEQVMSLINEGQVFRLIPKPVKEGFIRLVVDAALRRHRQLRRQPELGKRYGAARAPDAAEELARDIAAIRKPAAAPAGAVPQPAGKHAVMARLRRWFLGA
jgi:serine/threonine-protein kinase